MEGIKIEVTGNTAMVAERPKRITAGTVGLPVEFTFDSVWDGLDKTAVFKAGDRCMVQLRLETETVVPWEILTQEGMWLSIGTYGTNKDGSVAIPTTWANVCPIIASAQPEGDPSADPTLPVYQKLMNETGNPDELKTNAKDTFVNAINEIFDKTELARSGIVVSDKVPTATPVLWFNTSA